MFSSNETQKPFKKILDEESETKKISSPSSRNDDDGKFNATADIVNMNSKILDLKNPEYNIRKQLTHKLLEIKDTRSSSPEYRKYITELLKIRIIRDDDGKVIRVHHLPEEVTVKPKARIIEIHDGNNTSNESSSITETYRLVKSNLSWSENNYDDDHGEIILDLRVKTL